MFDSWFDACDFDITTSNFLVRGMGLLCGLMAPLVFAAAGTAVCTVSVAHSGLTSAACVNSAVHMHGEYFSRMQAVLELARLQQLYEASILAKWPILQCPGSQHKPPFAFKSCPVGINSAQCTSFRGKSCSRRQRYFSKIVLHESFGAASSTVITL